VSNREFCGNVFILVLFTGFLFSFYWVTLFLIFKSFISFVMHSTRNITNKNGANKKKERFNQECQPHPIKPRLAPGRTLPRKPKPRRLPHPRSCPRNLAAITMTSNSLNILSVCASTGQHTAQLGSQEQTQGRTIVWPTGLIISRRRRLQVNSLFIMWRSWRESSLSGNSMENQKGPFMNGNVNSKSTRTPSTLSSFLANRGRFTRPLPFGHPMPN
jgi:hypothetical protein